MCSTRQNAEETCGSASPRCSKWAKPLPILLTIALVLASTTALWMVSHQPPPRHQGRTLTEWLQPTAALGGTVSISYRRTENGFEADTNHPYVQAIRAFGPQAIPVLRRELQAQDSWWQPTLFNLASKLHLTPFPHTPADMRRKQAVLACTALGTAAADLVPDLTTLLNARSTPKAPSVCQALALVGPAGFPPLLIGLTNDDRDIRYQCTHALSMVTYDTSAAVPALLQSLDGEDRDLRSRASAAIDQFRQKPERLLQALIRVLEDARPNPPLSAVDILGRMGTNAAPAAPVLRALLLRPINADTKQHTLAALARISPPTNIRPQQ